jgi:DNA-binding response OmpR family regulator
MKILIVEDEPIMATALKNRLEADNYNVVVATDGREALDIYNAQEIDLIITDIMMPYTSGLELIGIIRSDFTRKTPIIVLSGMGEEETVLEAFDLGADDFLTKPFNATELSTRVKRFAKKKNKN